MIRTYRLLMVIPGLCLALAGCSGDDDSEPAGSGPATATVTLYHPSGRIAGTGEVLTGTAIKSGGWSEYFDVDGSPRQWRRSYVQDTWDTTQDWREWNADGSIRNDATDH